MELRHQATLEIELLFLFITASLVWVDDRFGHDELRMIALAPETATLYYVAFVERGESYRIISLRRATRREVKYYVQNI